MDTIDEESTQSSADHTSSGDAMNTPSEQEDTPLFPHEADEDITSYDDRIDKVDHAQRRSEDAVEDDGDVSTDSDSGGDELDRYPLLSHESGYSDYKGSLATTEYVDLDEDDKYEEPPHYTPYSKARDDDGDAPLLPHERESAVASDAGSTFSQDDDTPFSLERQPSFDYENDRTRDLFGGAGRRHDIFRSRTNSSKLPHRLPQSDAEDENLNDPSLERFPTNRDLIFERVASIGVHLPEDESMHNHPQSPQPSVLSQACSSVDLVPVKSYTSLASVPEAENSDEDDDNDDRLSHDLESLPSPVYISQKRFRMDNPPSGFASDPNATPIVEEDKELGPPITHNSESNEAESVGKHDGANDVSRASNALHEAMSRSAKVTDAVPVTSEPKTTAKEAHPVAELDSELRQRRAPAEQPQNLPSPSTPIDITAENKIAKAMSASALAQQSENRNHNLFTDVFNAVFGRLGRLLTACLGDRKRASASAVVLGTTAIATYYYLGAAS